MAGIRYESVLIEQALAREYAVEMERALKGMSGLNDIKPMVRDFEMKFSAYIGVEHAVAVNSGSDALKMALLAAGVGPGDEVVVPDLTYQAVALAVFYCGARPVPVDARAEDLQMDPSLVEAAITKKTRAVIAAHMFGRPCGVERIGRICRDKKIVFIEDVCQAESSRFQGRMLGSFGDMAVFSFSYYKPLSSCGGGGGMVVFNDEKYNRVRHWMEDWRDDNELLNLGQRFAPMSFMDLIALQVKFAHLKEIIASRQKIKELYEQELGAMEGLTIFKDPPGAESVPQNFVVCCDGRDKFMDFLAKQGIMAQKPYLSLHQMEVFQGIAKGTFPVSRWYNSDALHLPLYSFMNQEKARSVIECCRSFLKAGAACK
ncbi:MAG: DegT/DnrJ/EryC1/StrS family aminotransferase [Candidatus Omnitrophota bacterium]|nr:DegT/DnrJ/EryC1/StrS family aminotransferase [Candidatus Omnitrophota bacterium]MDZ4243123.1 DegT/DnrJ/EryC1/StrS family aminotransferase [Candidatus Omnitrophota bacterium]